jgi:hypothetical protein
VNIIEEEEEKGFVIELARNTCHENALTYFVPTSVKKKKKSFVRLTADGLKSEVIEIED